MRKTTLITVLAASAGLGAMANADVLVSLTYDDLAGSFNTATQTFTANAVDTADLRSSGDASRLVPGTGNASFNAGFVSLASMSDFQLSCTVVPTGPNTAVGGGTFTATDINGDTITGTITGSWGAPAPGFIFFNGALSNVTLNSTGNGLFEGDAGGGWNMNLPQPAPYEGAIVQLVFGGSTFFTSNFANRAVGVTAQIIPAPGAIALVGLGGLAALRRRR
jgi:uncharacterized protein (TIGR03382 family)